MMSITHATIALAGSSLILGTAAPLALAILGSQLPDIDTTTSTIGQIGYSIAHWIEARYPHRTVTHWLSELTLSHPTKSPDLATSSITSGQHREPDRHQVPGIGDRTNRSLTAKSDVMLSFYSRREYVEKFKVPNFQRH